MRKKIDPVVPFSVQALQSGYTTPAQKKVPRIQDSKLKRSLHVGIADLDVYAGFLPDVLSAINASQKTFEFRKVLMPTRAGLSMSGERTNEIVKSLGQRISKRELSDNVYAPDLYSAVRPVLKSLALDAIGLLVSRMIIDEDEPGKLEWNLFWTSEPRIFIVSAYDLRQYADEAGRPIETCIANMVVAAAFATLFPKVGTHPETRGCIYDYCEDRDDVVKSFRKTAICTDSLALFPKWVRPDVKKVLKAIATYRRRASAVKTKSSHKHTAAKLRSKVLRKKISKRQSN